MLESFVVVGGILVLTVVCTKVYLRLGGSHDTREK